MSPLIHKTTLAGINSRPDSEALRYLDKSLSYKELEQRSANIAAVVRSFGVTKEQCIALYIGKQIETILAIYGILRAGALYVPLDTKNPASRIQYIIDQCAIPTIITTPDHVEQLTSALKNGIHNPNIIVLSESNWSAPSNDFKYTLLNPLIGNGLERAELIDDKIEPDDLAAILYTSGSTGVPKGVMMTHRAVTTFTNWAIEYFELQPSDKCISHAPLHFDLSLLDIFASHHAGASVLLIPDNKTGNPKYITDCISREKITIWQSVPSALVLLYKCGDIDKHQYPSLRHVLFAGEVMHVGILTGIAKHFNGSKFHNIYGATETNNSFIYSIPASSKEFPDPLPIGKPLPYVEFKVVNSKHKTELEGELQIKTSTLMRGYRQTLDKSSLSRITDGQVTHSNDQYYLTRDLVRILDDGNLIYCGRTDDIIKSNGYRVNTLEIESILQGHKLINDATVITTPDDEIGNKIIAIISTQPTTKITSIQLKMFCSQQLPKYAIPHIFEISSNPLPKTSSGKTNKRIIIQSRKNNVQLTKH